MVLLPAKLPQVRENPLTSLRRWEDSQPTYGHTHSAMDVGGAASFEEM